MPEVLTKTPAVAKPARAMISSERIRRRVRELGKQIEAEVVGFHGDKLFLMPTGDIRGVMPGARVIPTRSESSVMVGDELLGRVLDGAGRSLDGFGELRCTDRVPLTGEPLNPLMRRAIRDPLDVGVRSINALLSVGGGQQPARPWSISLVVVTKVSHHDGLCPHCPLRARGEPSGSQGFVRIVRTLFLEF